MCVYFLCYHASLQALTHKTALIIITKFDNHRTVPLWCGRRHNILSGAQPGGRGCFCGFTPFCATISAFCLLLSVTAGYDTQAVFDYFTTR